MSAFDELKKKPWSECSALECAVCSWGSDEAADELAQLREDAKAADTEHAKLVELSDLYQQLHAQIGGFEIHLAETVKARDAWKETAEHNSVALDKAQKVIEPFAEKAKCCLKKFDDYVLMDFCMEVGEFRAAAAWLKQYPDLP